MVNTGRTDARGKEIYTCSDRFVVSRIGYDEERNINDLVIKCKSSVVYSMRPVAADGKELQMPEKLDGKYVNSLVLELKRTGVGLKGMLKCYGVTDVHDLRFDQYKDAMDKLSNKPDAKPVNTTPPDDAGDGLPWNTPAR